MNTPMGSSSQSRPSILLGCRFCGMVGEFQGIMPRGERRSWQADDHFLVFTGRAHGLRYWLNDQLLGNGRLGAATQVLRFRANSSGIEFLGPNFQSLTSKATTDQP